MIEFKDILEYCQIEAISSRLSPTEVSVWRALCRSYSKMFHTPLHLVLEMSPEHVILNVYEEQTDELDIDDYLKLEHLMDVIKKIEDPEYAAKQVNEQEDFDRKAEQEEADRVKSGRPVYEGKKKTLSKKTDEPEKKLPTGGYINLEHLSKQDSEG